MDSELIKVIEKLEKELGSYRAIADKVGVTPVTISNWVNQKKPPSYKNFKRFYTMFEKYFDNTNLAEF